ncbi:hypothetical protein [Bradyrhizobium centrosematis]|uniref:hypothetical protein n=1 Tax=Bradyrhizobium centrosematis TaxID=1300039 RepID=UPI00388E2C32
MFGRRRRMDRELQYHARMNSREKQAKAVKRKALSRNGRKIGAWRWRAIPVELFISGRICPAAMCRRGMRD